ncbi:MAG: polyhydroxyalkanoate synthesis repressor PhaR [Hyphomicrobiaceae bacterium]
MLNKAETQSEKREAVVIKKYANRRLYNTETSTYVTLEDLAAMVRQDRDFVVYDAKTGDDLTHSVLTQIIVEQEGRAGGQTLLPVPFLRQLIRFYDDAMGKMVPSYLQFSLENLAKEQERFRTQFSHLFQQNPFGAAAFEAMQQQTRKNMAMFEQAMSMWPPFAARPPHEPNAAAAPAAGEAKSADASGKPGSDTADELAELKAEFAKMQAKIEKLTSNRE